MSMLRDVYFWLVANPLALLLLGVGFAALAQRAGAVGERAVLAATRVSQGVVMVVFAAVVVLYFTRAAFIDHVEPQIAAVGWLHHTGEPIYHALDGSRAYSGGPYGPGTILVVSAAYALFGPSLVGAKATSALALAIALIAGAAALRRVSSAPTGRQVLEFLALVALPYGAAFWLRADPWLLALGAICAWSATGRSRLLASVGCAASLGAVMWLKVHAPLYLLPAFVLFGLRHGWGGFLLAGFSGALLGLAQLLPWEGHGKNYVALLGVYGGNPLAPALVWPLWQWALFLSAPLWLRLLDAQRWRAFRDVRELRWTGSALGLVLLALGLFAARPGLGYWHFLPLAPITVVLAARVRLLGEDDSRARVLLAGWWLAVGLLVFTRHDDVVVQLARNEAAGEAREIDRLRAQFPDHDIVMGLGSQVHGPSYRRTFQRAHLALAGEPYRFDQVVLMDYQHVGAPPGLIRAEKLLPAERPAVVLVPAGEAPWSTRSIFGGQGVPPEFRSNFFSHFRLRQRGERYDVWANAPAPQSPP